MHNAHSVDARRVQETVALAAADEASTLGVIDVEREEPVGQGVVGDGVDGRKPLSVQDTRGAYKGWTVWDVSQMDGWGDKEKLQRRAKVVEAGWVCATVLASSCEGCQDEPLVTLSRGNVSFSGTVPYPGSSQAACRQHRQPNGLRACRQHRQPNGLRACTTTRTRTCPTFWAHAQNNTPVCDLTCGNVTSHVVM
eukprot:364491-Chlamydomonas_euryale.AAC.12